eukprot:scaffold73856_cov21-Tisochrysis_lutea.AAC.7
MPRADVLLLHVLRAAGACECTAHAISVCTSCVAPSVVYASQSSFQVSALKQDQHMILGSSLNQFTVHIPLIQESGLACTPSTPFRMHERLKISRPAFIMSVSVMSWWGTARNCFLASLESIQGFELGAGCLAAGGGVGSLASSMQVAGIGLCLSALLCALCQKLSACNTHPSMLRYCGRPSVACALPLPLLAQSCAMHGRVCDHRNRRVACARTRQDV